MFVVMNLPPTLTGSQNGKEYKGWGFEISGYINTAIKLGELFLGLQVAPEECGVFVRSIQRVRTDRAEAL